MLKLCLSYGIMHSTVFAEGYNMGIGGISVWQLVIILAIVITLFGTKRLGSFGADLGNAIRGFKKTMQDEPEVSEAVVAEQAPHDQSK